MKASAINVFLFGLFLFFTGGPLLFSKPENLRTVSVLLAVDDRCASVRGNGTVSIFKTAIQSVSKELENDFSIRLEVAGPPVRWKQSYQYRTIDRLFPDFMASVPKTLSKPFRGELRADVVIGLVCGKKFKGKYGLSLYRAGYVLVRGIEDKQFFRKIVRHEIFHLFGATHVDNTGSVMDRFLRGGRLLSMNRELIKLHRDRDFKDRRFPLEYGKMEKAVRIYRDIARENEHLRATPRTRVNRNFLRLWVRSGNPPPGPDALRFLRRDFNRLDDVYIRLAFLLIELKQYPEALLECSRVLRINPASDEANNLAGIALRRSGNIDDAITFYRKALDLNPRYQRVYYNLGIAYMKKGDTDMAISAYRRAVSADPNFADAWNNLGFIYLEQRKLHKAAGFFRKAVEKNPYYPLAHANLAETLLWQGDLSGAMRHVREASRLNNRLPGVFNILGKIYRVRNRSGEAEKAFKQAIRIDKNYGPGYYNLGNLLLEQKKWLNARDHFNRAIDCDPGLLAAYSGIGDAFLMEGRYPDADWAYRRALEQGYGEAGLFVNWSTVKIHRKQYASAITLARQAAAINGNLAAAHYNIGLGLMITGREKEAEQAFKRAVAVEPGYKDGWSGLGDLYLQTGNYRAAADAYGKSLEIDSTDGAIHNNMAVVLYYLKEYKKALDHLNEAERLGIQVKAGLKQKILVQLSNFIRNSVKK